MKSIASALLPVLFMVAFQFTGTAATISSAATTNPWVTFRLRVVGVVSPTMTFWIAYREHEAVTRGRT